MFKMMLDTTLQQSVLLSARFHHIYFFGIIYGTRLMLNVCHSMIQRAVVLWDEWIFWLFFFEK